MTDTPDNELSRREAEVISRPLPSGHLAKPDFVGSQHAASTTDGASASGQEPSFKLQGGDIHQDLFKVDARSKVVQRSATYSRPNSYGATQDSYQDEWLTAFEQRAPRGFRR